MSSKQIHDIHLQNVENCTSSDKTVLNVIVSNPYLPKHFLKGTNFQIKTVGCGVERERG